MLAFRIPNAPTFTRLHNEMDRLFERFFGNYEPSRAWDPTGLRRFPSVNVWQDDFNLFIETELPGLTEEDIDVTISGDELAIKGERVAFQPSDGMTVHQRERGSGAFNRVVYLPVDVNGDKVEAMFCNGVLTITLAKAEVAKSRRIPVKALSV